MSDMNESTVPKPSKPALIKTLPTERVSFDKQLSVLRAYAAASGPEKKSVSNDEVAAVVGELKGSSVSLCNPFLADVGLLIAEGRKQKPSDAVFDYHHAYGWDPEKAAQKLRPVLAETWAAKALLPKLAFRQLSKDEAIAFLADESKATKNHRRNLETLLDFLSAAGAIRVEGNVVLKAIPPAAADPDEKGGQSGEAEASSERKSRVAQRSGTDTDEIEADVERFTIPIPGKTPATITVPRGLDADDWEMLSAMIGTYINRLRGSRGSQTPKGGTE